ncbi:MAG: hypothetical protein J5770_01320 [Bacteroidaceae bacterium]|nr:hypothetical protein [Bacteroidaceae bacterium]
MSDGNFNRALLPKNELTAGIRAGKAQMRTKAAQAFQETIDYFLPEMTEEEKREMKEEFMSHLRK